MYLEALSLESLRIIEKANLCPGRHINLIFGKNGSGKTSILEAVHLLSRAKSFRTVKIGDVINHKAEKLVVSGKLNREGSVERIGIERSKKEVLLKYKQQIVKTASEQAQNLPILMLSTESHVLLNGNPRERRKWLDWLMFHVEQNYLFNWKAFQSSLRQRNRLLRNRAKDIEFEVWEKQMDKYSEELNKSISKNIEFLNSFLKQELQDFLGDKGEAVYRTTWEKGQYLQNLQETRQKDRERGFTASGPHRAEIQFLFAEDKLANKILSRGQAKLYLTALLLAQARFMQKQNGSKPLLLIDDVAAELDDDSKKKVSSKLIEAGTQSFLTTTEPDRFEPYSEAMFHVKHGSVEKMI